MRIRSVVALAGMAIIGTAGVAAAAYPGQQLAGQANVTLAQARAVALGVAPGKIVAQELEKEAGGSGLRYTFDVKTKAGVREVGVDAKTGSVLENSVDKP